MTLESGFGFCQGQGAFSPIQRLLGLTSLLSNPYQWDFPAISRGVKLITHFRQVLMLRTRGATQPLPHKCS